MQRPGKLRLRELLVAGKTKGGKAATGCVQPDIGDRGRPMPGAADTGPDEGPDAPPGPQIELEVGEGHDGGVVEIVEIS
jgi:hypothetical protein